MLFNTINSNACPNTLTIFSILHAVLELRLLAIDKCLLQLRLSESVSVRQMELSPDLDRFMRHFLRIHTDFMHMKATLMPDFGLFS